MENILEILRKEIDEIDKNIVENFEKRMAVVCKIAEYKEAHGLNTFDPNREQKVIEKCLQHLNNKKLEKYVKDLMQHYMDLSKLYQTELKK